MLLRDQILESLTYLQGGAADIPCTVNWTAETGCAVAADLTVVDTLGCAFRELRVTARPLQALPFDTVKAWAEKLCQKVTYLLEHIGPLEADAEAQSVLVRSVPPTKEPDRTRYYEIVVQAPGQLALHRYVRPAGSAERAVCDIQVTHEVLVKLVQDIVAAV